MAVPVHNAATCGGRWGVIAAFVYIADASWGGVGRPQLLSLSLSRGDRSEASWSEHVTDAAEVFFVWSHIYMFPNIFDTRMHWSLISACVSMPAAAARNGRGFSQIVGLNYVLSLMSLLRSFPTSSMGCRHGAYGGSRRKTAPIAGREASLTSSCIAAF